MQTYRGRVVYDRPKHYFDIRDTTRISERLVSKGAGVWADWEVDWLLAGAVTAAKIILACLSALTLKGAVDALNAVIRALRDILVVRIGEIPYDRLGDFEESPNSSASEASEED